MFRERILLARDEKKYCYSRLNHSHKSQSTLEFALILPLLVLMILGIMELAFLWHQQNSLELAADEIAANLALVDGFGCYMSEEAKNVITNKTAFLQERKISFSSQITNNANTYTSNESFKGKPFVVVKVDCIKNSASSASSSSFSVQLQAVHRLHFFSASLPNFRTGSRITIIPDNVTLISKKKSVLTKN